VSFSKVVLLRLWMRTSQVVRVLLEVRVDLDGERRGNGGEQTDLSPSLARFRQNAVRDSRI